MIDQFHFHAHVELTCRQAFTVSTAAFGEMSTLKRNVNQNSGHDRITPGFLLEQIAIAVDQHAAKICPSLS